MTAEIKFRDLEFNEEMNKETGKENNKSEEGKNLAVRLLKIFYFEIPMRDIEQIGKANISGNTISFSGDTTQKKAENEFNLLIGRYISHPELGLKSKLNGNPAAYIHANSGIPLIGTTYFGIIDKGTDMIEIKPLTGCNLNCAFCSVDEGINSRKNQEFVVECEYLSDELKKLLDFKKQEGISVYINPHGEPLLYQPIVHLAKKISEIKWVSKIIIITNGALLNKNLIDQLSLIKNLHKDIQLNISISAIETEKARAIMGTKGYDINKIKQEIEYAAKKIDISLTPVLIKGINEDEMGRIIEFAKKSGCKEVKIQNFLYNKKGRNPAEAMPWKKFEEILKKLEKKHDIPLVFNVNSQRKEGKAKRTAELKKPFKTGDIINARIAYPGRYSNELIGVAETGRDEDRRTILIKLTEKDKYNQKFLGRELKVKIKKCIHNLYNGELC